MSAAPIPPDEAERLKALARYDILDTEAEAEFDDFTHLASLICKTPVALISLLDASRQWFKSKVGTDVTETPREMAFCGYAILGSELMEVPNAVEDTRFRDNALVTGAPDIRFYAGMPLITPDGFKLGTLCVIDRVPRHLTPEQGDALARLGRQVVRQLELRLIHRRHQETGAFQRGILECADYSIISTSPDGVIRTFNRAAERMLGYRAEDVVGKATPELIHDREEVVRRAAELTEELGRPVPPGFETFVVKARAGRAYEQEWTYVRQDGTRFPVQLSITAMRDEAGQIIGFLGIAHDITRRREAQARVRQLTAELEDRVRSRTEALAESEQRFRGTFEQAAVGVAHVDLDGHWLLVNDWVCHLVGYPRAELMRKTFQDITHPDDLGPDLACVQQLLAGQIQHYGMDKRYFHKNGSIIWVHLSGSLIRKADGTPHYFIAIIQDIRARKAAEEALRQAHDELENRVQERTAELGRTNMLLHSEVEERRSIEAALRDSETRLRTVIDSTPDWIFIKDTQFRFRLVNRSLAQAFHREPGDFIGKDDLEMGVPAELVLGDQAKGIRGFRTDDREVIESGLPKVIAEEPDVVDGRNVVLNTVKVPLRDGSGKVIGVLGYVRDITERKAMEAELREREEQLRDLFENATDLIQSVAPDGHILFVNRAWLNTLGYRLSELAGLNIFDVIHPDCLAECRAQFQRVMQGEPLVDVQAAFRTKGGEKIYVEGNASCRIVDGQPVASRAIFRDVTKRKAVEAERERLITELQAALAEVKTLSGLLPICGWCKKIRDDSGYWDSVEGYLKKSTGMDLTHGICPECSAKMMADLEKIGGYSASKPDLGKP